MSKISSDPLTRGFENRPVPLTIWATGCEGGRIVGRSCVLSGAVVLFVLELPVPPAWLERAIPLDDIEPEEDASCR